MLQDEAQIVLGELDLVRVLSLAASLRHVGSREVYVAAIYNDFSPPLVLSQGISNRDVTA